MANGRVTGRALARAGSALAVAAWLAAAQAPLSQPAQDGVPTLGIEGVRDATGLDPVRLELRAERTRLFAGETLRLTWRASFDPRFFEERLVQLFQRPLDVPVQIQTRGLDVLGPRIGAAPGPGPDVVTLAFDEEVAGARRLPQEPGSKPIVLELERSYRLLAQGMAGELELAPALLRYASATRFREDLFQRVPLDREDAYVRSQPLALSILPLPEEGRPPDFSGLVGSLAVRATAEPETVHAGEHLRLELSLTSDGDLDALQAPRLDETSGLSVLGTLRHSDASGLTLIYDVVPESEALRELPSVPFVVFDPTPPGAYRIVRSSPVEIRVLPPAEPSIAAVPEHAPPAEDAIRRMLRIGKALIVVALLVALAVRAARQRARSKKIAAPAAERTARARAAFHARAAGASSEELSHALVSYLATLLDVPEASVIGPDLCGRLVTAGVDPEPAARAAELLDELVGERYGGPAARVDEAMLRSLVDDLVESR